MRTHWVRCGALIVLLLACVLGPGSSATQAMVSSADDGLQVSVTHSMGGSVVVMVSNTTDFRRDAVLFIEIHTISGSKSRRYVPISVPARSTIQVHWDLGMPYSEVIVGIVEGPDPIPR
ncbi:MAG: hypothetical protein OEV00_12250 [Acidobacteriota bacterium]|nr:hypothetical protein [Acidobacteriota bacterium]MDH3786082.1 hypothetical protein [Acidobacteriota bacterium]